MAAVVTQEAARSLYDVPLYSEADVLELLMLIGRPDNASAEALAHVLSEFGKTFASALEREASASTPQREKAAGKLARACGDVLAILGVENGGDLLPMFAQGGLFAAAYLRGEPHGKAATMNAIRAVDLLRQDALKMMEIEGKRRRMKPPRVGHPGNGAMRRLVRDLSCLYEQVWARPPGVSTGDKPQPSGPLMRLMEDITAKLKVRLGRHAFSATPSSLRRVWQRIDAEDKMPVTELVAKWEALDTPAK
jgi:hypothetical protein